MPRKSLIVAALLLILQAHPLYGEDLGSHSPYKVTYYNLGAPLHLQQQGLSTASGVPSPLMITGGATDILYSEHQNSVVGFETDSPTGHSSGLALSAEFTATDRISLQGTFGMTRNLWTPDLHAYGNTSSWEANLGFVYRLVDDLAIGLHFGYMDTGDLFNDQSIYNDVDSIIMISNQLTLSF